MSQRECAWFLYPLDEETNLRLCCAKRDADDGNGENDLENGVLCVDGESRSMWRASNYEFVAAMQKSAKSDPSLKFKIYVQAKGQRARLWSFRKKKKSLVVKKIKKGGTF